MLMACACKVNQQLSKIREEYGVISNENKGNIKITLNLKKILVSIIILMLSPLMIIYILGKLVFSKNKEIDIRKFFLKKTYGKQ